MSVRLLSIFTLLMGLMLLVCKVPSPPPGPENSFVALEFKSSSGNITTDSLTDTVGKQVKICMIHNLTQYIDVSTLRITKGTDFNEMYSVKSFKGQVDTTYYPIMFSDPGIYAVSLTGYIEGEPSILNGTITIVDREQTSYNRAPKWSIVTLQRSTQPESLFSLYLGDYCSDPDNDNLTFSLLPQVPAKGSIVDKLYQWTPDISDTGVHLIPVIATDPSGLSDTMTLELTISKVIISKPDLVPPVIVLKSPLKDTVITADSCEVTVTCVDDSGCAVKGYCEGVAFDMKKTSSGANLWTGIAKGITAGSYSTIKIVAEDSSAAKNRDSVKVRIKYDNDNDDPIITRLSPMDSVVTTNESSFLINVKCIDPSGVASVKAEMGSKTFTGSRGSDNSWSVAITGLSYATNAVALTATDSSYQKNSTIISFKIIRDSTILDAEPPTILKIAGPESGSRVKEAKGNLSFTITDYSGVDSVWWTINDEFVATVPSSGEDKYTISYTLSDFGKHNIKVFAKDKSVAGNKQPQTVTLNYNTEPSSITLTAPLNDAADVSTSPTFKWSGGDDTDGEAVTFTVNYGLSQSNLSSVAEVTGKTATINSPLVYAKTYYWQVTANSSSSTYPDKIQSEINSFTTNGSLPVISSQPKSQTVNEDQSVTFSVSATGFGDISYQWQENGTDISGQTDADFTISTVTTEMNGKKYRCVIKNEVGEVISNAATLTVNELDKYKLTYNDNYATAHNAPAEETYKKGEKAIIKAPPSTMTRTGCNPCTEWCLNWNCGTTYKGGESITMNSDIILSAHWQVAVVFVNGTSQSTINTDVGTALGDNFPANPPDGTTQRFDGWYNGTTKITNATKFESGMTVTAKWIQRFKVTYDLNGGDGTSVPEPTYYDGNSTVTVISGTGITKDGFTFDGWKNSSGSAVSGSFILTSDVKLIAQWKKVQYLVTFKNNVSTQTNTEYYDAGSTISSSQYPGFSIGGYELSYWDKTSITVNGPMTVTAYYTALDCSISGNDVTVWTQTGETFNLIVTPNKSACKVTKYTWYTFSAKLNELSDGTFGLYTAAGQGTNTLNVKNITGGAYGFCCIASFENGQQDTVQWPTQFKPYVNFNPGDGSGDMDAQQFTPGVAFKLNQCTYTRAGYRFAGWCVGFDCSMGTGFADQATVTFSNESVYLTANWIEE